jgi:hypothetical protein
MKGMQYKNTTGIELRTYSLITFKTVNITNICHCAEIPE